MRAYTEIVDFIASGTTPSKVASFVSSDATEKLVADLIAKEKAGNISADEKAELNHFLEVEHIMRPAKAKARKMTSE